MNYKMSNIREKMTNPIGDIRCNLFNATKLEYDLWCNIEHYLMSASGRHVYRNIKPNLIEELRHYD